jgi:orotidine-5'-phosphate decarboxylase
MASKASQRLIVALDVPTVDEARALIETLGNSVGCYKIGLELLFVGGADLARELIADGLDVFIDAKLLDIPRTVEHATANIAEMGAKFLTVHGHDRQTLEAAAAGRGKSALKLLAVTVLTSVDGGDLAQQGVAIPAEDLVAQRAKFAKQAGFDGVVASPAEVGAIRAAVGPKMTIITPGIRPAGSAKGDQKRVASPATAIKNGADYLVIGRPITQAEDPAEAAKAILGEIKKALK